MFSVSNGRRFVLRRVRSTANAWPKRWIQQRYASAPANNNNDNRNLCLVGPPGSGKGSYGRHVAKALGLPLVTTSDVLRVLRPDLIDLLSGGKLVDDAVVGDTVLEGLVALSRQEQSNDESESGLVTKGTTPGYVLDGFPRTLAQVQLMEERWPEALRVGSVVHLDVPDRVCLAKLLGRRSCSSCGKSFNVHGVFDNENDEDGGGGGDRWWLPPHLPEEGGTCGGAGAAATPCDCDVKRDDDTPEIAGERLKVYHQHADPLLEYFRVGTNEEHQQKHQQKQNGGGGSGNDDHGSGTPNHDPYRVITLRPYRGFDDLPELVDAIRAQVGGEYNETTSGSKRKRI